MFILNNDYSTTRYTGEKINRILTNYYGINVIEYRNSQVNFNPVAEISFDMENNMRPSRRYNFDRADEMLANYLGVNLDTVIYIRETGKYTWHEMNDGKTIQLVLSSINSTFGHVWGISELK